MTQHHRWPAPPVETPAASRTAIRPGPRPVTTTGEIAPGDWFARPHPVQVLKSAPEVREIRIEINGCFAGAAACLAEATREFAVGWALLHRFFSDPDALGTVTGSSARVAIMLDGGPDIDRLRAEAVGWETRDDAFDHGAAMSSRPPRSVPFISQHDVMAVAERALARIDSDGGMSGLIGAALTLGDELVVIARDVSATGAVAKLLGWRILERADGSEHILVVGGLVDEIVIEGAIRAGIGVVVSDAEATTGAIRRARASGMTVLSMVMSHRRHFCVDGGHVGDDGAPGIG